MCSKWSVCTAGFIHIILGLSLFISQVPDACSPAPHLASYIFAVLILAIAAGIPLYSERYSHLPYFIQFLVETLGTLALLEVCDLYVWCSMERLIHYIVQTVFALLGMDAKVYLEQEYWILVVPTTGLVACFVFISSRANLLRCRSLLRRRNYIHLNREVYMEMLAAKNRNRRLNYRIH